VVVCVIAAGRTRPKRWCVFLHQQLQTADKLERLFRQICGLGENMVRNPLKVHLIPG